ncbi:MAG: branched-chain amino acid ABC transporter ATP-binding protein/permease [Actinomycetia bacterium]|nr:branched-chain amino acid ABC transporter ATP-binding protein/permease [Actinomycetes bacterium]
MQGRREPGYVGLLRYLPWVGVLVLVVLTPLISSSSTYYQTLLIEATTYAIANLGFALILGYTGQISLAQAAFFGVGAYIAGLVAVHGHSIWLGFLLGVLGAGVAGLILGFASVKMGGHYLAMATIGFQVLLTLVLTNWMPVTGGPDGVTGIPRPSLFGVTLSDPTSYLYFLLVVLALVGSGLHLLRHRTWGRALRAIRENELAANVLGVNIYYGKTMAFVLGAAIAGLGGALYASAALYISPDEFSFDQSVTFLAMTVVGGAGSAFGTALGSYLLTFLPELLRFMHQIYLAVYGAIVLVVIITMPNGIWGFVEGWWNRLVPPAVRDLPEQPGRMVFAEQLPADEPVLVLDGVSKSFGGLKAVDNVSFEVEGARAHALVGPNGSGKTTVLNLVTGVYPIDAGEIRLLAERLDGKRPYAIAALGVARTFQNIRLAPQMTVIENVMLGYHRHRRHGLLTEFLWSPRLQADERQARQWAWHALHYVGLADRAFDQARNLAHGQQRLVELARALVSRPKVLLLDEPAAGLNDAETQMLVGLLRQLVAQGTTLLLIEHDMNLVTKVATHVTVLNFGQRIADGTVHEVLNQPQVIEAFLGREEEYAQA